MLTYHPTTEAEKEAICAWQYPGEYAMYNNPPYAEQKKHGYGFANPASNFYSFYDGETLVGFVNLLGEGSEVFFGIGGASRPLRAGVRHADDGAGVGFIPAAVSGQADVSGGADVEHARRSMLREGGIPGGGRAGEAGDAQRRRDVLPHGASGAGMIPRKMLTNLTFTAFRGGFLFGSSRNLGEEQLGGASADAQS